MRCFACGEDMRVVALERYDALGIEGFVYKVWECSGCHDLEKRLVFGRFIGQPGRQLPASAEAGTTGTPQEAETAAQNLCRRFLGKRRGVFY